MFNFFNTLSVLQKSLIISIVSVVLFVSSAGASYSYFSKSGGPSLPGGSDNTIPSANAGVTEDPSEPRTEECPLDGGMHTQKAKDAWQSRRPLAVMIENHQESRPQSGLSTSDVVYEAVAEGGITRFMAIYLCELGDFQVGPVRSARTYYLDWLGEYDALYAHVGGANTPGPADALSQIVRYGVKDLNQFSIGFPTFWRDYQRLGHPVATEHTMYSSTSKLWAVGTKRGWENTPSSTLDKVLSKSKSWEDSFAKWKFKDEDKSGNTTATKIDVTFWQNQGDYSVGWNYDGECGCYKRKNGGVDHTDLNNKQQIAAKNVVVQFQGESHANDGYPGNVHLLYKTTGQGKALIFQDGKVIEGKWIKSSRVARTKYVDDKGAEISFNRGQIWIQTVPEGSNVKY